MRNGELVCLTCVRSHTRHKEIDTRTTLTRIIMAVLAVATLTAVTAGSALASEDLPRGPGVVSDSVMVAGTYEATGYTGGFFNRGRVTETGSFNGVGPGTDRYVRERLSWADSCVGDLPFATTTEAGKRWADGSVEVLLIAWTFGGCPHSNQHGFNQKIERLAPGESVTLNVFARNGNGAVSVSATFTNIWTPKIDTTLLERSYVDFAIRYRFNLGPDWVAMSGVVPQKPQVVKSPKIDLSQVEKPRIGPVTPAVDSDSVVRPDAADEDRSTGRSPKIDMSVVDKPGVTVPLPVPPVDLGSDLGGSAVIDAIDLTNLIDLTDLVTPTITIQVDGGFEGIPGL